MARSTLTMHEVLRIAETDPTAALSALDISPMRAARARVHLVVESCSAEEAMQTAAAWRTLGHDADAQEVVQAVLDHVLGMGGVPQGAQRGVRDIDPALSHRIPRSQR